MKLIPAIDLLDGKCVRLRQGDFKQVTFYPQSPHAIAQAYSEEGAEWLHVVDLAASRDGHQADSQPLFELLGKAPQQVQTGGGVRAPEDVRNRLNSGASRVVVGSIAAESPDMFRDWLDRFGSESLVAALDVRINENGTPQVRTHGWTRDSGQDLWSLLDRYSETGFKHLLCTDIGRDGLLNGPNLALYEEILSRYPGLELQASGGIRNISDLKRLAGAGCSAAISGKALLEKQYTVRAAIQSLGAM